MIPLKDFIQKLFARKSTFVGALLLVFYTLACGAKKEMTLCTLGIFLFLIYLCVHLVIAWRAVKKGRMTKDAPLLS